MCCLSVALLNRKGGVAKSTTTRDLGGAFAAGGKRVLLIDMDPQASLTEILLGAGEARELPELRTAAALFGGTDPSPQALIYPVGIPGLSLVPSAEGLELWDAAAQDTLAQRQTALREFVRGVAGDFDVVLIDCPPALYGCAWASMLAVDWCAVPVEPDALGVHGLPHVRDMIGAARAINLQLELLGYIITKYQPRLTTHQLFAEMLRESYGGHVFVNAVPLAADVQRAGAVGLPVGQYKPRCASARAVKALADEMALRAWTIRANADRGDRGKEVAA